MDHHGWVLAWDGAADDQPCGSLAGGACGRFGAVGDGDVAVGLVVEAGGGFVGSGEPVQQVGVDRDGGVAVEQRSGGDGGGDVVGQRGGGVFEFELAPEQQAVSTAIAARMSMTSTPAGIRIMALPWSPPGTVEGWGVRVGGSAVTVDLPG